jgi:hypothetical protein
MKCGLFRVRLSRHRSRRLWWVFLLVAFSQATHAQANPLTAEPFVVVEEPGAPGKIESKKLAVGLHLMIEKLHIEATELPTIVIYHISPRSAQYIGLDSSSIFRNTGSGKLRYEMWIIGRPSSHTYSYLLESVLAHHFHVSIGDEARSLAIREVEQDLNMTLDAR